MQSLRELYRYGMGPSSSHTMGPRRAAEQFRSRHPQAAAVRVTLYGSLSLTGRGHLTDQAVAQGLQPLRCEVVWSEEFLPFHPNGMHFQALDGDGAVVGDWTVFSIGGGELRNADQKDSETPRLYSQTSMQEILDWACSRGKPFWALAETTEGADLWDHLGFVWVKMQEAIAAGLDEEGSLPGGLNLQRKARGFLTRTKQLRRSASRTGLLSSYALAVAEHNAGGGFVITAPTCGSCGIVPAVLFYLQKELGLEEDYMLRALATAGLVGNVVKHNASISGADVGCQGEVGVACAMAAAAAAQLLGGSPHQIEYAAEMGLEHHLGLTCDPILGLVQVPCIERNCFAAIRALAAAEFAMLSDGRHLISFDQVVEAMQQTGHDLPSLYRETAQGGLAKVYQCSRPTA
ncbi:L-serine ammonia-lyase [Desulfonatronum thiosulfatophilum]|uniref:L-serine ammonia-lyase n=1 Tax=Desulfonatronum thiosulfatophilum TaxID=617002 RepID=A0A1G6CUD5_9BACT|nr:L-serine ammonia-lyase, iron-sulfur-dependent, subunit alpha [Desulfonatronum thiosulfatophilum]SDB36480.1 L-serine ammonia-lyase [Desulfonatronum thiosulfatophilum]